MEKKTKFDEKNDKENNKNSTHIAPLKSTQDHFFFTNKFRNGIFFKFNNLKNIFSCGANFSGNLSNSTNYNKHIHRTYSRGMVKPTIIETLGSPYKWYSSTFDVGKVIKVALGLEHTLFLTKQGKSYGCGRNSWGELPDQKVGNFLYPIEFKFFQKKNMFVKNIFATRNSSFFYTDGGVILGGGLNEYGNIGCGNKRNRKIPVKVLLTFEDYGDKIYNIMGGDNFTLFHSVNGDVYYAGRLFKPVHLSTRFAKNIEMIPKKIYHFGDEKIKEISFTSEYFFFISQKNEIFGMHNLVKSNNGLDYTTVSLLNSPEISKPFVITRNCLYDITSKGENILKIACGQSQVLILTSLGNVYGYGCNMKEDSHNIYNNTRSSSYVLGNYESVNGDNLYEQTIRWTRRLKKPGLLMSNCINVYASGEMSFVVKSNGEFLFCAYKTPYFTNYHNAEIVKNCGSDFCIKFSNDLGIKNVKSCNWNFNRISYTYYYQLNLYKKYQNSILFDCYIVHE